MTGHYVNAHHCQLDAGNSLITRSSGCTWTALAGGVDAATGGRLRPGPDEVKALVRRSEETSPATPGWSIPDAARAMRRLGVPFTNRSGAGFPAAVADLLEGHYIVLQGDSDRFGDNTCSGRFDGDHAIGVHPNHRVAPDGVREWWIDDPICATGRWEREDVLRAYSRKLALTARFGRFDDQVPLNHQPVNPRPGTKEGNVTIRYLPEVASSSSMRLVKGQVLYASPGGDRLTEMSRTADVPYIGHAGAVNRKTWRAVVVRTAVGYDDGVARPTVCYVPDAAGPITHSEEPAKP